MERQKPRKCVHGIVEDVCVTCLITTKSLTANWECAHSLVLSQCEECWGVVKLVASRVDDQAQEIYKLKLRLLRINEAAAPDEFEGSSVEDAERLEAQLLEVQRLAGRDT